MTALRTALIRLAHANPELRPHLLPLLKEPVQARTAKDGHGYEFAIARFDGMTPGGNHEQWSVIHDENGETRGKWAVEKGHGANKSLPQLVTYYPADQFATIVDLRKVRVAG